MLSWFVDQRVIGKSVSEQNVIQEEDVEVNPDLISLVWKEVDIELTYMFFSEDAWKVVTQAFTVRRN